MWKSSCIMINKAFLLGLLSASLSIIFANGESGETAYQTTLKTESAKLKISIAKPCSPSNCSFRIEITNLGTDTLRTLEYEHLPSCTFTIQDRKGRPCPYTELGAGTLKMKAGSLRTVKIAPGGTSAFILPLEKYFAFHPGDWIIDCSVFISFGQDDQKLHPPKLEFSILETAK